MSNEMSNVLRRRSPATSAALAQDVWRVEMRGAVGAGYQQPGQRGRAAARLGTELRRLRLELGISQRRLTQLIGLSAHSNLGEYERGRRIPPCDIVVACERLLAVQPGYLQHLRSLALRERAREHC
ncbi:MAG TPA: helix-turn-helix transcriptional regulator [Streptosporangiaceae bacterium]|nr:helix-turn-helix transcriptional regulator [Streptosporangiaceae bacterium]